MSIFRDAHDLVINDSDFQNIQTQNNIYQHGSSGIDILYEASTPEAAVDAEERSYAPSCYPGTREQYIDDITKWATAGSSDSVQPIYWMKGSAGVGKSAIAQTCSLQLKDAGHLGAAFFFSINGRRKDHTRFFPSLAYQLSTIYGDYREILNRKISMDRSLVKKTMASQFRSLVVEPLQELKKRGKEAQRRAIFIDGLDECESQDAQVEIIQIIALSVRSGSAPFRWAIFSREEPHIVSTFFNPDISSHCYTVFLPVSRKADEEIELYLRGGFENILQRRNLLSRLSSWPTVQDIRKLVDAAAGLFAHSATVLRFIDRHSYSGFEQSLESVITSITNPGSNGTSLYVELDKIYTLILQRVPEDILPTMLLLLSDVVSYQLSDRNFSVASICNIVGVSEAGFRSTCHYLQAVLIVRDPPRLAIDEAVTLGRSYYDQDSTYGPSPSYRQQLLEVHGTVGFYHKSFYDFLTSPERSSVFCVTTPTTCEKHFNRYVQQHSHYASGYTTQNSELVLAPGIAGSFVLLSWPQGDEFVDSFIVLWSFCFASLTLFQNSPCFGQFLQNVPLSSLQKLGGLDYHKFLIADKTVNGLGLRVDADVAGYAEAGSIVRTDHSAFTCIDKEKYHVFDPAVFLRTVEKFEKAGVIRPYSPRLGSSRGASLLHTLTRQKPYGRSYGQYKMGHGDKSVIWYWEFDTEERYFHEFRTVNYGEAMAYYKEKKFGIWE